METESSNFLVASSPSSSSSSSSSLTTIRQWKYDVFLSFRGEDTRDNFTSHLHAALSRKGINTFKDNELERGEHISPALLTVIEESKIVVIIFSKDYASSSWCLKELEHIIKCMESLGHTVLPIFYHVDPLDIAKQSGIVAESFAKHEKTYGANLERVRRWKDAMTKAANLSGWDSKVTKPESQLVDEIAKFILRKLEKTWTDGLEGLVGIYSCREQVKELLSIGSLDVRIIGIWGMGGIGKTTIAEDVYMQIACNFEACCFLANVREESENFGLIHLGEKLLSRILEEKDVKLGHIHGVAPYFNNHLHRKKVLIVLDDVSKSLQIEFLAGDRCWFGPGSRIILTSRNKQVLGKWVDEVYEVEKLNFKDALQLFSWHAFKKNEPPIDQAEMSKQVVKYADGIPLALQLLGGSLYGKSQKEWKSALNKLEKAPNRDINSVLETSFDSLDEEEQDIFLHIACFFKGEDRESVTQILDSCGFSTDIGLSVLLDKSLITISGDNKLEIHDLLQEMGRDIARRESKEPGKRRRLCNQEDIYQVLTKNKGTDTVEGIILDISKIGEIELHPSTFARMPNLKFLKFYTYDKSECFREPKLHFSRGIKSLPNKLRYLYWHGYPLKVLPANFHPVDLVELNLPYSNMKRLWKRSKHLEKLKKIDLSFTRSLVKFPDPTMAPNLMGIYLTGCTRLLKVPSSISCLSNLTHLSLRDCKNIESIPSAIDLNSLETLDAFGCLKLETFPSLSRNMKDLKLDQSAIKEVPSSVDRLTRLVQLSLGGSVELEVLPTTICKLKSLESLNLNCCSNLKNFPDILEVMDNLSWLCLSGTAVEELPSSIDNLKGLKALHMYNCRNFSDLPESFSNLIALKEFNLTGCSKLGKLPSNLYVEHLKVVGNKGRNSVGLSLPPLLGMSQLYWLNLADCNLSSLPADLGCLSSLSWLDLSKNNFETMPTSIKQLSNLKRLYICHCWRLKSLPELPSHLNIIDARDCTSLRTVSSLNQFLQLEFHYCPQDICVEAFVFYNCFQLCKNARSDVSTNALSRIQRFTKAINRPNSIKLHYPGSEIPECFAYKSIGPSILIQMPPYSVLNNNSFLGFALCVVVSFGDDTESFFNVEIKGHFKNRFGDSYNFIRLVPGGRGRAGSEHVLLCYDNEFHKTDKEFDWAGDCCYDEVSFEFQPDREHWGTVGDFRECFKVTKCGVHPLYAQDKECSGLETPIEVATWRRMRMNLLKEDTAQNQRCLEAIGSPNDDGCEHKPPHPNKRLKQN